MRTSESENSGISGKGKVVPWLKKYFWEGQTLTDAQQHALDTLPSDAPLYKRLYVKHKRLVGLMIPAIIYHFFYWAVMIEHDLFYVFIDKYYMSLTMIAGSIIAGMTCAGGGAVAFPVMTLAFSVKPSIARDFSIMIQSFGMTAAAFTIFFMRVQLELLTLGLCSITSLAGLIFGLHVVDPHLEPQVKKMVFVSMWFAFAFVLYLLNRDPNRKVYNKIPDVRPWKVLVLLLTGFIGGIFTSWAGSGLDLCVFSVTTTLFRLSEKIATPTSVILMGVNSVVAFFWRAAVMDQVDTEAWEFMAACLPIVVLGAPLGSLLGTHFHRQVLAASLYIVTTAALIGAFVIVDQTVTLGIVAASVMVVSCSIFALLTFAGKKLLVYVEEAELDKKDAKMSAVENGVYKHESPQSNGSCVNDSTKF